MILKKFLSPFMKNFSYLVGDEREGECAVIDPSDNVDSIISFLKKSKLSLYYIVLTHSHRDHALGVNTLSKKTSAYIVKYKDACAGGEIRVEDGSLLKIGEVKARIIYTPGHSPDSICILIDKNLFTGDTLFVGECGRTDLPGGDSEALFYSLKKLLTLPDEVLVYPGHDYGELPDSTIGEEKKNSYVIQALEKGVDYFIKFMRTP